MNPVHYENFQFIVEDENLMFRLREPNLNLVVSYLRTDGSTMDEYSLYRFEWKDDQWLAHVDIPLLNKKIETVIELYSEYLGLEEAKGVPLNDLLNRVYTVFPNTAHLEESTGMFPRVRALHESSSVGTTNLHGESSNTISFGIDASEMARGFPISVAT